jgi:hypothetical protein
MRARNGHSRYFQNYPRNKRILVDFFFFFFFFSETVNFKRIGVPLGNLTQNEERW